MSKFTEFNPTIVPLDVQDPAFPTVCEENFSALQKTISYIGQDLGSSTVMKAKGTSTASISNIEVDVPWASPTIEEPTITVSGVNITFAEAGTYMFDVSVRTTSNNRTELLVYTYVDADGSSGYTQDTDETASNYVSVDSDQDTGGITLSTALVLAAGAKVKFAAEGDCAGTCVLMTAGTHLRILKIN